MGLFSKPKKVSVQPTTQQATEEKEDTAKAKARLLETEGKNKGVELNAQQGRSVRRVFG
ncbi:MAG: hypothetical protein SPL73_05685 [Cyanobacteriota bacterium]|nr:hypothetical protein [Cyanobacteriota bacterium]MDY6364363.1 hypothetical protein [Cyanobacteriota bacterium]